MRADRSPVNAPHRDADAERGENVEPDRPAGHPLGPRVTWQRFEQPWSGRLYAAVLLAGAGVLLMLAARLKPDGRQLGTHQQLGLPPCGFITVTGFPCPTCGMTTAFANTVRGRFVTAARCQPAGFLAALATAAVGLVSAIALVTGWRPVVNWYRLDATRLVWRVLIVLVAAWGIKILIGLADGSLPVRSAVG